MDNIKWLLENGFELSGESSLEKTFEKKAAFSRNRLTETTLLLEVTIPSDSARLEAAAYAGGYYFQAKSQSAQQAVANVLDQIIYMTESLKLAAEKLKA